MSQYNYEEYYDEVKKQLKEQGIDYEKATVEEIEKASAIVLERLY